MIRQRHNSTSVIYGSAINEGGDEISMEPFATGGGQLLFLKE